jgi:putative zinc finger protein
VTEHLSSAQVLNYHRLELAPAELLGADDHLAECLECRRLVESALVNDAIGLYTILAEGVTVAPHLNFDQSASHVDGLSTGEERRMIEDHLASCARCATLTADLRDFRNEIAPHLDREYLPQGTAPATEPRAGLWDRVVAAASKPFLNIPSWIYAATALSLLTVVWWMATSMHTPPQIAHTTPTPSPSINFASPTPEIATALIRLNDGGSSLALDTRGRLTGVDQWPSEYRRMAEDALSNQRAPRSPLLAGMSRPGSSLMGGDNEGRRFAIIEPAGIVLLTDRPTFKWTRLDGAEGYVVEVYDARFEMVSSSPTLTDVSWTTPRLARGQFYSWQVKAIRGGQDFFIAPRPTAPQAKFRILDRAAAAEISRARREYASSHLLLGLLYARAGLLAEAEQEFRALQKANPDLDAPRKLTASVSGPRRSEAPTEK